MIKLTSKLIIPKCVGIIFNLKSFPIDSKENQCLVLAIQAETHEQNEASEKPKMTLNITITPANYQSLLCAKKSTICHPM